MGNIDVRTALQRANLDAAQRQGLERQQQLLRQQQNEMIQRQRDEFIRQFIAGMAKDLYLQRLEPRSKMKQVDATVRHEIIDECQQLAIEFAECIGMIQRQEDKSDA